MQMPKSFLRGIVRILIIQTIFKLTPGKSTDTDYILPEFEGKFKKWCVNNKIDALTKDFEE